SRSPTPRPPPPTTPPLFPYTTLFRSRESGALRRKPVGQLVHQRDRRAEPRDGGGHHKPLLMRVIGEHDVSPRESGVRASLLDLRSEEHTSELQSLAYLVCRLLLEKKK